MVIVDFECSIFGNFKVGDNVVYNSRVLSDLVEANQFGRFNKMIVLQVASLLEAAFDQIFYRAKNFNREGVPQISPEEIDKIAGKSMDKLAVMIDGLRKHKILEAMSPDTLDKLTKLRKFRNKIHIQVRHGLEGEPIDEVQLFSDAYTSEVLKLNWEIFQFLEATYPRPPAIRGYVRPLRLPRP